MEAPSDDEHAASNAAHKASNYVAGNLTFNEVIPAEVIHHILSVCDQGTQISNRQVCRLWRDISLRAYPHAEFLASATDSALEAWFTAALEDYADVERIVSIIGHNAAQIITRWKIYAKSLEKKVQEESPARTVLLHEDNIRFYSVAMISACALKFIENPTEKEDATKALKTVVDNRKEALRNVWNNIVAVNDDEEQTANAKAWWTVSLFLNDFYELSDAFSNQSRGTYQGIVPTFEKLFRHPDWNNWESYPCEVRRGNALTTVLRYYFDKKQIKEFLSAYEALKEIVVQYGQFTDHLLTEWTQLFSLSQVDALREKDFFLNNLPPCANRKLQIATIMMSKFMGKDKELFNEAMALVDDALLHSFEGEHLVNVIGILSHGLHRLSTLNREEQHYIYDKVNSLLLRMPELTKHYAVNNLKVAKDNLQQWKDRQK